MATRAVNIRLPLSSWTPDAGLFNNPGLLVAQNLVPFPSIGFVPGPGLNQVTSSLGSTSNDTAFGIGATALGAAGYTVYHGTTVALFRSDPTTDPWTVSNVTRLVGGAYTMDAEGWFFLPWGDNMLATPGLLDAPQYMVGSAANFVALVAGGSPFNLRCKYITAIGQRVMMGHVRDVGAAVTYPHRVWWSFTDDPTQYGTAATSPTQRTGFQDLFDEYGSITGLSGAADYAYIFKQRAIYRMDFGGPFGFEFKPIAVGYGTNQPHSIARVGDAVFFWGPNGPAIIENNAIQELSSGSISRALYDTSFVLPDTIAVASNPGPRGVWTAIDSRNGLVLFAYNQSPGEPPDSGIWFSLKNGNLGYMHIAPVGAVTTNDYRIACMCSANHVFQSWTPGNGIVMGTRVNSSNDSFLHTFDETKLSEIKIRTPFLSAAELANDPRARTWKVNGVRLIHSKPTDAATLEPVEVVIWNREKPTGTTARVPVTPTSYLSAADESGLIDTTTDDSARYKSVELWYARGSQMTATGGGDLAELDAIELQCDVDGDF